MTAATTTFDLQSRPAVPAYWLFFSGDFPVAALILAAAAAACWALVLLQRRLPLNTRPRKPTSQHDLTFAVAATRKADASVERLAYESGDGSLHELSRRDAQPSTPMFPPSQPTSADGTSWTLRLLAALSLDSIPLGPTAQVRPVCHSPKTPSSKGHHASEMRRGAGSGQPAGTPATGHKQTRHGPSKNQLSVLSMDSKKSELQPAFACFVGKYEPDREDCQCRHYKDVRTLCRSTHLNQHQASGDLDNAQREKIRHATKGLKKHEREVERWRDLFVELYPDFDSRRSQLNPYFGQPLLPSGEDPRTASASLLREDIDNTLANARRTQSLLFQVLASGNGTGPTAAALSHTGSASLHHSDRRLSEARTRPRDAASLPHDTGQRSTGSGPPNAALNRALLPALQRTPSHDRGYYFATTLGGAQALSEISISDIDLSDRILYSAPSTNDDAIFSLPQTPLRQHGQTPATTLSRYTSNTTSSHAEGSHRRPSYSFPLEPHHNVAPTFPLEIASYPDSLQFDPDLYNQDETRAGGASLPQSPLAGHPSSEHSAQPPLQYVSLELVSPRHGPRDGSRKRAREQTP